MIPPDEPPTSIIDRNEKFKQYYKVAEEEPQAILALVAQQSDKIVKDLDEHKKKPINKAHPIPNGWKPTENQTMEGEIRMSSKTFIKLIIIISVIATGGIGLANYLGLIGG